MQVFLIVNWILVAAISAHQVVVELLIIVITVVILECLVTIMCPGFFAIVSPCHDCHVCRVVARSLCHVCHVVVGLFRLVNRLKGSLILCLGSPWIWVT